MFTLAIETATERVGVAVGNNDGVRAAFEVTRGRRHAETLTPAIELVCRQADVDLSEISVVAVDVGPGMFTGLRVGLATGKAMSQALDVPMIGMTSLELLAHPLRHHDGVIAAVMDGRKGEVFFNFFRAANNELQTVGAPTAGSIEDFIVAVDDRAQEVICVGDGALRYRENLDECRFTEVADQFLAYPSASALIQRTQAKVRHEDWVGYRDVAALYLRRPDAEINWSTREPQGVQL